MIEQPAIEADHVVGCFVLVAKAHRLHCVIEDDVVKFVSFIHHTYMIPEPLLLFKQSVPTRTGPEASSLVDEAIQIMTQRGDQSQILVPIRPVFVVMDKADVCQHVREMLFVLIHHSID